MSIKMRTNVNSESICSCCKTSWVNTRNMLDYKIGDIKFTLCYKCSEELFRKSLNLSCVYSGKIKDKTDQERLIRENRLQEEQFEHRSVSEALKGYC